MYVDVFLFENILINFFILSITSKLSKFKTTNIRIALGAAFGSIYSVFMIFPSLNILYEVWIKIAVSILMIIIVFGPNKINSFLRTISIFYFVSFSFGGAAFSLFYFTGKGKVVDGVFYIEDFPLSMLIMAFVVGFILLKYCFKYIQHKILKSDYIYDVYISINGKHVMINAMIDTGNSLKDPISNTPVIVVEYESMLEVLPDYMDNIFDNKIEDLNYEELYNAVISKDCSIKIRLIPFKSIGKQNGMIIGIKPDIVKVICDEKIIEINDSIIGIVNNKISKDGEYNGLLYPEIFK
jgi:stage II sporulation protein GA (sporulation sigma-E factor processing peptidase)